MAYDVLIKNGRVVDGSGMAPFHGDVAVKDEEGHFWFQGRDDDIISSAGYRIGPGEVEECLAKHPAVALAGVIGAPDPIRGEVVAAFIVLAKDREPTPALVTRRVPPLRSKTGGQRGR